VVVRFSSKIFGGSEKACDRCGIVQKNLCDWDGTSRGKVVGEKLRLCADCTRVALTELFHQVDFPCVAVEPVLNKGGYYALTVDEIPEFWALDYAGYRAPKVPKTQIEAKTNEIVGALRQIAERAGEQCTRCQSNSANCCWVAADVFDAKWDIFFALVQERETVPATALCATCAGTEMARALDARNPRVDGIWPPRDGTIVILSAKY
jgi:hypothetical protein